MTREDINDLYDSDLTPLVATAGLILGSREAAEDVVQDCFERFSRRDGEPVVNPSAYLRRMVINQCNTVLRRRSRERLVAEVPDFVIPEQPLVDFKEALDRLSPRRRTAIVLRYFCDMSVGEIALHLDARPSTVSSLIHRALKDLREVL